MGLYVNTYGTAKVDMTDGAIAREISKLFDMRPAAIENRLKLRNPIYGPAAAYGHMGRKPETKTVTFENGGRKETMEVEFFTWEKDRKSTRLNSSHVRISYAVFCLKKKKKNKLK